VPLEEPAAAMARDGDPVHATGDRTDVQRALARLKERDQQLLWLAYAEGSTHQEIAASLGLRTSSVKTLLFRARQRLAALLPRRRETRTGGEA
jgi:RNA polymerase sigma-70 factor (ECF subfamily)